jgi:hypothetical protein
MTHKNSKKVKIFLFLKCWVFFFRVTSIVILGENLNFVQMEKCQQREGQPHKFLHCCQVCDFKSAYPRYSV